MSERAQSLRPGRPWIIAPLLVGLLGGCPGGGGNGGQPTPTPVLTASPTPVPAAFVRREIHSFSSAEVDAYRQGVALMQSRPGDDPTSWVYQANMHGFPANNSICPVTPGPAQPAWSTCQHGSFFFLAWHRMYLYYFERILRAAVREATADPNYPFALPFWDYENPAHHALPAAFRSPADASNPLFVSRRTADCNNGAECVSAAEASDDAALSLVPFCSCSGPSCPGCVSGINADESFAGGALTAPDHSASFPGELELQPHGVVHNAVGGPGGWMSYFTCAARDPIFWLHHANIDRIWQLWLNQGAGRANPLGSDAWKNQQFTFFDENRTAVTMTGCQILDTIAQLDYQYEGVPVSNVTLCSAPAPPTEAPAAPQPPTTLAAAPEATVELGRAPVSVSVALPQTAAARMLAVAGDEPGRVQLVVEGLRLHRPGVLYQVYLNLPPGAAPDPRGPSFVGHVALFGDPEHATAIDRTFDITGTVARLREAGRWGGELRVTFVPGHSEATMAAAGEPGEPFFRLRRVSVRERQ